MENKEIKVPEIRIVYKDEIAGDRVRVRSSRDVYSVFKSYFEECMQHHEEVKMMCLNQGMRVLGVFTVSVGMITEASVDVRILMQAVLLSNAVSIMIAHNHPSGNRTPSAADRALTKKITECCKLFDVTVLDHMILTDSGYYSFADEGEI